MIAPEVIFGLSVQLVLTIPLLFLYKISMPFKCLIGLGISVFAYFAFVPAYDFSVPAIDNIWDIIAILIWAAISLFAVLPVQIRHSVKKDEEGHEEVTWFSSQTKWVSGRKIYSLIGLVNLCIPTRNDIVGHILPMGARQSFFNLRKLVLTSMMHEGGSIVTGASGSGKTVTLINLISQKLKRKPIILIDYKGDRDLINKMKKLSNKVTVIGSSEIAEIFYDPFSTMNESSIIETFMNMRKWDISGSDSHYKTSLQAYLSNVIPFVLRHFKEETNPGPFITYLYRWMGQNQPTQRADQDAAKTLKNLISILMSSTFGEIFSGKHSKKFDISNLEPGEIVILSFSTDNKGIGTSVTSFFVRDLISKATAGLMKHSVGLYIDEFASMEDKIIVKDILEKGRSLGIETVLSFQDVHQIAMDTNENYSKTIFGVVNTFIVHAGVTADSARYYSGIVSSDDLLDQVFINLKKPSKRHAPTCVFISRYGNIRISGKSEMWMFIPKMNKVKLSARPVRIQEDRVTFDLDAELGVEEAPVDITPAVEPPKKANYRQAIPAAEEDTFEGIKVDDIDKFFRN